MAAAMLVVRSTITATSRGFVGASPHKPVHATASRLPTLPPSWPVLLPPSVPLLMPSARPNEKARVVDAASTIVLHTSLGLWTGSHGAQQTTLVHFQLELPAANGTLQADGMSVVRGDGGLVRLFTPTRQR